MPDLSEKCECGHSEEKHASGQNNFCWGGDNFVCQCSEFKKMEDVTWFSNEYKKQKPSNFNQVFGGNLYQVARYWNSVIKRIATVYGSDYIVGTAPDGTEPIVFVTGQYGAVDGQEKHMSRCWGANTCIEETFANQIKATWERVKDRVMEIEELSLEVEELTEKIMQRRRLAVESNQLHGGNTGGKIAE